MSEYVLADGAEDDLEKIAEYTIDRWGVEQARKYGAILARQFGSLADQDVRTKPFFEDRPSCRCRGANTTTCSRSCVPPPP